MFYDWNVRPSVGRYWKVVNHKIKHLVGGVTDCIVAVTVFVHVSRQQM